jgi:hypothetical protein
VISKANFMTPTFTHTTPFAEHDGIKQVVNLLRELVKDLMTQFQGDGT